MACLPRPVMMRIWLQPEAMASSTPYWMMGLSTRGSISLGWALVAGRKRVPRPAAGMTTFRTGDGIGLVLSGERRFLAAQEAAKVVLVAGQDETANSGEH